MASLIEYATGRYAIQFVAADDKRPIFYLGKVARRDAEMVRMHTDFLVNAVHLRQPIPRKTAEWLTEIDNDLHRKIAKAGLVKPREAKLASAIGKYFDDYIARRTDVGATTINNFKQVKRYHVLHFGADRDIATITRGEMQDWHRFVKSKLSQPTVAMHVKKTRQVFADALDRRLIDENPVRGIKAGSMENRERFFYVTIDMAERVIEACPDAEWRLIFALSRYAGLRTPSEAAAMKWSDIHWSRGRMIVRSAKTAKQGKASREVPIFPEILPRLREAYEQAVEGASYVIAKHRGENLRTMATKIVTRAGIDPWGKLFQNMRSSCETDLTAKFPLHVACAWVGNTESVARKHYLQVTDGHFADAIKESAAKSAADTSGQYRTNAGNDGDKTLVLPAIGEIKCPRRGSNSLCKSAEKLGVTPKALCQALRRLQIASPYLYHVESTRLLNSALAQSDPAKGVQS